MRYRFLAFLLIVTQLQAQKADTVAEKPIGPADRAHWSFDPPRQPEVPKVAHISAIRAPIDRFLLAKLEPLGLSFASSADKLALLRRVHIDLVGRPPTPEDQDDFLADSSPRAYEKVVDRLLTSPQYGERWAQHWLDAVRFAESNGYEADSDRPHAWRYRDYVVDSLNADKPYDRFLTEQLAGDELAAGKDKREAAHLLIAAGLHRCGPVHLIAGNVDLEILRQEVLTEYVQGIGAAVLGLTINCARCHDHKFDPVSQADYYRLEAFFAGAQFKEVAFHTPAEEQAFKSRVAELDAKIKPLQAKVAAIDTPYITKIRAQHKAKLPAELKAALEIDPKKRSKDDQKLAADAEVLMRVTWDQIVGALSPEDRTNRQAIRDQIHALEAQRPAGPPTAWTVANDAKTPPTHVLKRGETKRKGAVVEPGVPRVLVNAPPEPLAIRTTQLLPLAGVVVPILSPVVRPRLNRIDLAKWITSPEHPLTARVFMNRVWGHHFGHGLVRTPNDFGLRGEKPTHPELLDYLATEFMAGGWKLKPIQRMIVLSEAYRQGNRSSSEARKLDPENKLLSRFPRPRLSGEAIRDAMLSAAGTLNGQIGGPSVKVPLEPETYDLLFTEGEPDGLWPTTPDPTQHTRRSLYLFGKRNVRLPVLEAFDQPDRLTPCADRAVSTFAPQALILMNGPLAQEQSRAMATTVWKECGPDATKQIERAYRRAFSRPPSADELADAKAFLADQAEAASDRLRARKPTGIPPGLPPAADLARAVALADLCLALFNANEFVYGP